MKSFELSGIFEQLKEINDKFTKDYESERVILINPVLLLQLKEKEPTIKIEHFLPYKPVGKGGDALIHLKGASIYAYTSLEIDKTKIYFAPRREILEELGNLLKTIK